MTDHIRQAAVLGAGVMGAQIAAVFANAEIPVLLYDLPGREGGSPNALVERAVKQLAKLEPAPLTVPERDRLIRPANYDQHLDRLRDCNLIVEAIAERPDLKAELYRRVAPQVHERAALVSNTSGLSIGELAAGLPQELQARFCGMHFFNPPRYMTLVELIPAQTTDAALLDDLETFLVRTLGKGVVRAKDTPNFIANRLGVFSLTATLHHAEAFGLAPELVDALTGPVIGRPKSATFRTMDLVGLDVLQHVVNGSAQRLGDDPWAGYLRLPGWIERLIEQGALGQKSGAGIYRKQGKEIRVFDPAAGDYRPAETQPDEAVQTILASKDPAEKLAALRASDHPQAQFLWALQRDVYHYAAVHLAAIADNARDADLAMRWGFGWQAGPFESWQAVGWRRLTEWIGDDIDAGRTLAATPLPDWVAAIDAVHTAEGSYAPAAGRYRPRSTLPVYRRQRFLETVLGEARPQPGTPLFETEAVRLWHDGDGIAVLGFKTRRHTVSAAVLDGVCEALAVAERDCRALVIWQDSEPFSFGADLKEFQPQLTSSEAIEQAVVRFQRTTGALRASRLPVVGALRGMALGGGCEFLMHCDQVVAARESYVGLVEAGVGLLPAGGGCKELTRRAASQARGDDPMLFVRRYFETVAMARVAKSAEQARDWGLLPAATTIIGNPQELLHVAKACANALTEANYGPPLPRPVRVLGRTGVATLEGALANMRAGGYISDHDYAIARHIATALCGGGVEAGSEVSEDWLLGLERRAFVALAATPETQARIEHTLRTGKPLRN